MEKTVFVLSSVLVNGHSHQESGNQSGAKRQIVSVSWLLPHFVCFSAQCVTVVLHTFAELGHQHLEYQAF